ncbi:MAG: sigma-70 family RNA polymerase sigma factor [Gemmataceae bacterium]
MTSDLRDKNQLARLEAVVLPHLDAAYNLARWLTGKDHDAEDVVQEAYLRASQFFDGFHGVDGRAWLLTIVRNTCYTWLKKNRPHEPTVSFDDEQHSGSREDTAPEGLLMQGEDCRLVRETLEELPPEFREVIVLRELEGMSYKEVATIIGVPVGTVMSRLARGRERLQQCLTKRLIKEP